MTDAHWFITTHPDTITVSTLHFTWPALEAALTSLNGTDHSDKYTFPAHHHDQVATIIETTDRVPRHHYDLEDAEAARLGLVREDNLPQHGSHPLGHRTATTPGATIYDNTTPIYDRS